ncbi:MAG: protein phosphatase 2C domain-containing protein [Oscillospiraceae bacterium]
MITSYNFSIKGRRHIKKNLPCQDASGIKEITPIWTVACVADGVGACRYADIASKIAVESVLEMVPKLFPAIVSDDAILTILSATMHYANNKILEYVEEHDYDINECETTLVIELYNGKDLYYANAGDSGIVALDENGKYHTITKVQKGKDGISVIPLSALRFEVGKADFSPVAVIGMTDGLLEATVPAKYKNQKYPINVPFAKLFTDYGVFGCDDKEVAMDYSNRRKDDLIKYLTSDNCAKLDDDLSASVLINTDAEIDDIPYEAPDEYLIMFEQCSIYGKNQNKEFINVVRENNPNWSDEQVNEFVNRYINSSKVKTKSTDRPTEKKIKPTNTPINNSLDEKSSMEKNNNKKNYFDKTFEKFDHIIKDKFCGKFEKIKDGNIIQDNKPLNDQSKVDKNIKPENKTIKNSTTDNNSIIITHQKDKNTIQDFQPLNDQSKVDENKAITDKTADDNSIVVTHENNIKNIKGKSKVEIQIKVDENVKYKHQIIGTSNTMYSSEYIEDDDNILG